VSFQFDHFKNQWLTCGDLLDPNADYIDFRVEIKPDFFKTLQFDSESLKKYRIDAALSAASQLGNNPVLCLSGGVDSQAMVHCWKEAGLKFDVATLVFNDGLNLHDVNHARHYCTTHGINLIELDINIITFLVRESAEIADLYKCSSPHFVTHYKMFEILIDRGYTGICCGGQTFAKGKTGWGPAPSAAQANYIEFARKKQFPVMGNFLGHDPNLCWATAVLTPTHQRAWQICVNESTDEILAERYETKVEGYCRTGFNIQPQSQKFTGFELVKNYFAENFNDGWAFEKRFRHPLQKKYGSAHGRLLLNEDQLSCLETLYTQNIISS